MKFRLVEKNEIFDLTPAKALDEMVFDTVWECLETDVEKVNDFFSELEILSYDDPVCYNLITPDSYSEEYDDCEKYISDDMRNIANGKMFIFKEYVFRFLDDLIRDFEEQLTKYKKLQGR